MQLSYSTNVVLGATPRTSPVGAPVKQASAVGSGHVSKARESLLAPTEFKSGHQRRYTYLCCRSLKPPRPAPLLVRAQHGAHAAPHCLGSRLTSEPEGIIRLHAFLPESPFCCLFCYQEASKIFFELLCIVTLL